MHFRLVPKSSTLGDLEGPICTLNGFLMIQRQMTLKVYNVRKLLRPRTSDGFLTDSVDTTSASLYYYVEQVQRPVNCTIS